MEGARGQPELEAAEGSEAPESDSSSDEEGGEEGASAAADLAGPSAEPNSALDRFMESSFDVLSGAASAFDR